MPWFYKIMFATVCCSKFVNKFMCSKLTSEFLVGFGIGCEIHLSTVSMLWYLTAVWFQLTVSLFDQELASEWQFLLQSVEAKQHHENWITDNLC